MKFNIRTGDLVRRSDAGFIPPEDPRSSDTYLVLEIDGFISNAQVVNSRTLEMNYISLHRLERVG